MGTDHWGPCYNGGADSMGGGMEPEAAVSNQLSSGTRVAGPGLYFELQRFWEPAWSQLPGFFQSYLTGTVSHRHVSD